MIELVLRERCVAACDRCIQVCPTRVFDQDDSGVPVIARGNDCQTCFQCEAYCPTDALFVAPLAEPAGPDSRFRDVHYLPETGLLGAYRRELGWGKGLPLGARTAIGPDFPE